MSSHACGRFEVDRCVSGKGARVRQTALQRVRVEMLSETSSHHSESRRQLGRLTSHTSEAIRVPERFLLCRQLLH
jgi:hypothetical protein